MPDSLYKVFSPFTKSDDDQRIVFGIASTSAPDSQGGVYRGERYDGDLVETEAIKAALADYMAWANLREMHQAKAAGTVLEAEIVGDELRIAAKVVDDGAWKKVRENVYKGFSIGGRIVEAVLKTLPDGRVIRHILKMILSEISLVDRPANPDARLLLWKGAFLMPTDEEMLELMKAGASPQKIIAMIQAARNACESAGDLDGAALYTQAVALILQAGGDMNAAPDAGEATDEGEGEGLDMAAAAKLAKAGRKINRGNMSSLHRVLKSLLEMMSTAGDEVAQKMLGSYAEKADTPTPDALAKVAGAEFVKGMEPQLGELKTLFSESLTKLEQRLERIEAQPAGGGPNLRPVEKLLASAPAATPAQPDATAVIQKMIDDEPNPLVQARLRERLAETLTKRALFGNGAA